MQERHRQSWAVLAPKMASLVGREMHACWVNALVQADDALFNMSQTDPSRSFIYIDALSTLRHEKKMLLEAWSDISDQAILKFATSKREGDTSLLSLVSDEELEEALAFTQMADAMTKSHAQMFEAMDPAWLEINANATPPLSPQALSSMVKAWMSAIRIGQQARTITVKVMERELIKTLDVLLPRAIQLFQDAGWNIRMPSTKPRQSASSQAGSATSSATQSQDGGSVETTAAPRTFMSPAGGMSPEEMVMALHAMLSRPGTDFSQEVREVSAQPMDVDPLLATLVSVLQSRHSARQAAPIRNDAEVLSAPTVQSVLSLFQTDLPPTVKMAAKMNDRSLAHQFKQEMIRQAQQLGMSNKDAVLDARDEDTVDIVGMMFEVFLAERSLSDSLREEIVRLLSPYVKVAIADRKMFMHRSHPARRLLNVVAEACEGNAGETPQEKEILAKVTSGIDTIAAQFNEDLAIFETIEAEIRSFIEQHRARIELAERRAADTQKGRDRLEFAKTVTAKMIYDAMLPRSWPIRAREVLTNYWRHHHIVMLSKDDDAKSHAKSEALLNDLLTLGDGGVSGNPALAARSHKAILEMLASSGLLEQQASDTMMEIMAALEEASRAAQSAEPPPPPLPPPTPEPRPSSPLSLVISKDSSKLDPELVEMFRSMPVGAQVEFIKPDGTVLPGKMSWVSPISNRLLFVNKKGLRMTVETAEDLAQMVVDGSLRVIDDPRQPKPDAFTSSLKDALNDLAAKPAAP